MIELVVLVPLLVVLAIWVVEAGWALSNHLEVRRGANQGAELIAINELGGEASVAREVCDKMRFAGEDPGTTVIVQSEGTEIGDMFTITVTAPYDNLTGLTAGAFGNRTVSVSVERELLQTPSSAIGTEFAWHCSPD